MPSRDPAQGATLGRGSFSVLVSEQADYAAAPADKLTPRVFYRTHGTLALVVCLLLVMVGLPLLALAGVWGAQ